MAGWAKRGPVGIIDATLRDTKETFGVLRHHIETNQLKESNITMVNTFDLIRGKSVGFGEWLKVDDKEVERGQPLNKVREKYLSHSEMLNLIN